MALVNQAAFAKLHDVSRKTITKWKERGWLVLQGDLVDVEPSNELIKKYRRDGLGVVTQIDEGNKQGNNQGNKPASAKGGTPGNTVSTDLIEPKPGETNEQAADRLAELDITGWSFEEARRVKETYLALLNQLEYEQKAGSLVELDMARQVFFEEFRSQRDAWLNWPTRVGPEIAADLGIEADKVTEILTAHVHQHISRLGQSDPIFSSGEG